MEPDGIHPVLIDFGNARMSTGEKTKSITSIVTPGYAPFEQYTTRSKQGPWTDVYSLGAVLYRAISGTNPPDAADRIEEDPMIPAGNFANRGHSDLFLAKVDKALKMRSGDRWQTATEWKHALMEEGAAVSARTKPALLKAPSEVPPQDGNAPNSKAGSPSVLISRIQMLKPKRISWGLWAAIVVLAGLIYQLYRVSPN